MSAKKRSININILNSTFFDASPLGKILSWLMTIGKGIVFITFFITIAAFLYRAFILDPQVEALNEDIQTNIEYLTSLQDKEAKIRAFQNKLDTINTLISNQKDLIPVLENLEKAMPEDTRLEKMTFNNSDVLFEGVSKDELIFASFVNALKAQAFFSEISIDRLQSGGDEDPQIKFLIRINLNKNTQ